MNVRSNKYEGEFEPRRRVCFTLGKGVATNIFLVYNRVLIKMVASSKLNVYP